MDSDTNSDEAENICPICSRSFPTYNGIRVHWRVHSAEEIQAASNNNTQPQKPLSIDTDESQLTEKEFECGFDAENEQNYIVHMRSHVCRIRHPPTMITFQLPIENLRNTFLN